MFNQKPLIELFSKRYWLTFHIILLFQKLFNTDNYTSHVKDAFHRYVIQDEKDAVKSDDRGTKVTGHYILHLKAGETFKIKIKLDNRPNCDSVKEEHFSKENFDDIISKRLDEADEFYSKVHSGDQNFYVNIKYTLMMQIKEISIILNTFSKAFVFLIIYTDYLTDSEKHVSRQAFASLLFSKQFYHYIVKDWLHGDPSMPPPPKERLNGRNNEWKHLFNRDVISMPDKWEYPWVCFIIFSLLDWILWYFINVSNVNQRVLFHNQMNEMNEWKKMFNLILIFFFSPVCDMGLSISHGANGSSRS